MYECNYCGKEVVDLPGHVKRTHADKYKKGKRAETYGKQISKPEKKEQKEKKEKKKTTPRKPKEAKINPGALQGFGKDSKKASGMVVDIDQTAQQFVFASLMKAKGQKVEGILLRPTVNETRQNKTDGRVKRPNPADVKPKKAKK